MPELVASGTSRAELFDGVKLADEIDRCRGLGGEELLDLDELASDVGPTVRGNRSACRAPPRFSPLMLGPSAHGRKLTQQEILSIPLVNFPTRCS